MPVGLVYGMSSRAGGSDGAARPGRSPIRRGRDVEQHLACERLELPRTPVRGAADGVGVHGLAAEGRRRDAVRAGEQHPDERRARGHRRRRRVRPAVLRRWSMLRGEDACRRRRTPSSPSRARGGTCPRAIRFSCRSSIHFTGAPTLRAASMSTSPRAGRDLLPERAARVADDHADPVLGQVEQPRAHAAHLVRRLRRGPDRELAGARREVDDDAPPSIGTAAYACWWISALTTCAASSKTSSTAVGRRRRAIR